MIRHIVVWKLSAENAEQRNRDAEGIRERLEGLLGVVPGLVSIKVTPDLGTTEVNWDLSLVSEHDDEEALAVYVTHPAHVDAGTFVKTVVSGRIAVDVRI